MLLPDPAWKHIHLKDQIFCTIKIFNINSTSHMADNQVHKTLSLARKSFHIPQWQEAIRQENFLIPNEVV